MKFVMDDRIKHRLTGVVVIFSIAVLFLPAMLKKSNQHFEGNVSVSLKLPPKPIQPKVAIPQQTVMLKSVKVAHVEVPKVIDASNPSVIAKAEPLSKNPKSMLVKVEMPLKSIITAAAVPVHVPAKPVVTTTIAAELKKGYGIQLASFSQKRNAEYLVARLRKQGYAARYIKFMGNKGEFYQVVAGMVSNRDDAINLQKKLAVNMQLNGYIIQTGVS